MAAIVARIQREWKATLNERDAGTLADAWVRRMVPVVLAYRRRSEALARSVYRQQRAVGAPGAPRFVEPNLEQLAEEALAVALTATGIVEYLEARYTRDQPFAEALERSATTVAGAAAKHVLDGGRQYMDRAIRSDRVTVGWYRVTKAGACSFCAVLASRGAVYKEDSFDDSDPRWIGDGSEKVHDHCACTLAPLYSRSEEVPERNREYTELWERARRADEEDVAKGRAKYVGQPFSGKAALNSFRRKYEKIYALEAG